MSTHNSRRRRPAGRRGDYFQTKALLQSLEPRTLLAGTQLQVPYYHQGSSNWCWATSLSMVLSYYGETKKPWQIAADLDMPLSEGLAPQTVTSGNFERYLERDFNGGVVDAWNQAAFYNYFDNLKDAVIPALQSGNPVWLGSFARKHAIVVTGYDGTANTDHVFVHDPNGTITGTASMINHQYTWTEFKDALDNSFWPVNGDASIVYRKTAIAPRTNNGATVEVLTNNKYWFERSDNGGSHKAVFVWDGQEPYSGYRYDPINDPSYTIDDDLAHDNYARNATINDTLNLKPTYNNYTASAMLLRTRVQIVRASDGGVVKTVTGSSQSVAARTFVETAGAAFSIAMNTLSPDVYKLNVILEGSTNGGASYPVRDQASFFFGLTDPTPVTPYSTGQTVSGSITGPSTATYSVEANAGETIMAVMAKTGGDNLFLPSLTIYAPNGTTLGGEWDPISASVSVSNAPQTGTYTFVCKQLYGQVVPPYSGTYDLTIVRLPATADLGDGGALISGKTRSASIALGDIDVFTLEAGVGDSISVAVFETGTDSPFNPWVGLYAPDGTYLDGRWDYYSSYAGRTNAPQAGVYTVVVRDFDDDRGASYNITLARTGGAPVPGNGEVPIRSGETRSSSLGQAGIDIYTFDAHIGDSISIAMMQTSGDAAFDPAISLYAPDGTLLDSSWDYTGVGAGRTNAPQDGRYYIVASDFQFDGLGSYNLTLARLDGEQESGGDAGPIESGQTRSGTIGPGDIEIFTFYADIGDSISSVITKTSGDAGFNPSLSLYSPSGALLSTHWDYTATGVSELSITERGVYYLVANDYGADATGTYNLSLVDIGGLLDHVDDGGTLTPGLLRHGSIGYGDLDVFTFLANAGQSISVALTETSGDPNFTPAMSLYGPNGTRLSANWNYNSAGVSVGSAPLTGIYYVVTGDYSAENAGEYDLLLTRSGSAPTLNSVGSTANDEIYLRRNPSDPAQYQLWINSLHPGAGEPILSGPLSGAANFGLSGGEDKLTLDYTNGAPLPAGIVIDGGASKDSIRWIGTSAVEHIEFGTSTVNFGGILSLANIESRIYDGAGGNDSVNVVGGSVEFANAQQLASLSIADGATVDLSRGGNSVVRTGSLQIQGSGALDLWDNAMIIDYSSSPLSATWASLATGYAGGDWNGNGIRSSSATDSPGHVLGIAEAAAVLGTFPATFAGQTVSTQSLLIQYTLAGDANLDRIVDIRDLYALASNWNSTGKTFTQGDFDYTGKVDAADLAGVATNWQRSMTTSASAAAPMPAALFAMLAPVAPPSSAPQRPPVRAPVRAATPTPTPVSAATATTRIVASTTTPSRKAIVRAPVRFSKTIIAPAHAEWAVPQKSGAELIWI